MTAEQLTFSIVLSPEQVPGFQIPLNRSVEPGDKPRLSRQAARIYELLQAGPVKTSQLAAIGLQYNARVNEIRHALVGLGLMVDQREGTGGENEYHIVELEQSEFWQRVKEKNEEWKWNKIKGGNE